jgi:hypothetical protein
MVTDSRYRYNNVKYISVKTESMSRMFSEIIHPIILIFHGFFLMKKYIAKQI